MATVEFVENIPTPPPEPFKEVNIKLSYKEAEVLTWLLGKVTGAGEGKHLQSLTRLLYTKFKSNFTALKHPENQLIEFV